MVVDGQYCAQFTWYSLDGSAGRKRPGFDGEFQGAGMNGEHGSLTGLREVCHDIWQPTAGVQALAKVGLPAVASQVAKWGTRVRPGQPRRRRREPWAAAGKYLMEGPVADATCPV